MTRQQSLVRLLVPALAAFLAVASRGLSVPPPATPRPVAAWPASPLEVRAAFAEPLAESSVADLVGATIAFRGVGRLGAEPSETEAPNPGHGLRIAAARLEDNGRILVLATDPHPREAVYRLVLPGTAPPATLAYDLTGVEASWAAAADNDSPVWSGWWPSLEPDTTRATMQGSREHEAGFKRLAEAGTLTLRTLVELPPGEATLVLESDAAIEASLGLDASAESAGSGSVHRLELKIESTGDPEELVVKLATGVRGKAPALKARVLVDGKPEPLKRTQCLLPWAPPPPPPPSAAGAPPFALEGGDAGRGEMVFFSDEAKCSNCHKIRGKGGDVGPDLSDLTKKDLATLYRDVAEPSATIDPAYVPYTVALKSGAIAAGLVRAVDGETVRVLDTNAKSTLVKRSDIAELRPSGTSIMPVGLTGALGEARVRDLLAYLKSQKGGQ